jgi:resuscitation-promoting factor RpfA
VGAARPGGRQAWSAAAVQAGLGVLELGLVRLAGPPGRQLEVLRQLGAVDADPLASLLALLALAAEGLAAYLLVVLGLRLLALLPGVLGRLAAGAALRLTPVAVRRGLDLLLGGALLAQATLAPLPAGAAAAPPPAATAATVAAVAARPPAPLPPWLSGRPRTPASGPTGPAPPAAEPMAPRGAPVAGPTASGAAPHAGPVPPRTAPPAGPGGRGAAPDAGPAARGTAPEAGPAARGGTPGTPPAGAGAPRASDPAESGAAPAPAPGQGHEQLQPEPGGGRRAGGGAAGGTGSTSQDGAYTVRPGDTLWGIAAAHLAPAARSAAGVDRYWRRVYRANRAALGPDPDLIHPGTRLVVPAERPDRR